MCDENNFDDCFTSISSTFPDLMTFRADQENDVCLEPLFAAALHPQSSGQFCIRDDLLYKINYLAQGACFLLVVQKTLLLDILRTMHDDVVSGHLGFTRSLDQTLEHFHRLKM